MNTKRSTRIRALIASVLVGGVVALAAGPAAGLVTRNVLTPGVQKGNTCAWYVQTQAMPAVAGATACVHKVAEEYAKSLSFQIHAADTKSDGHSARTEVRVFQRTGGTWVKTGSTLTVTDSSGYNTSRVGSVIKVNRDVGADRLLIQARACTYESGPGTYVACGARTPVHDEQWKYIIIV